MLKNQVPFEQEEFDEFVVGITNPAVVSFSEKEFVLASGRKSNYYVNWRNGCSDAWTLDQLAAFVLRFVQAKGLEPHCFYGIPEGANKIAQEASMQLARRSTDYGKGSHVVPQGRKEPKGYGAPQDKFFVTAPRQNTIVIEDVSTTGDSILRHTEPILSLDSVRIIAVLSLTNRMERRDDGKNVEEAVQAELGLPYFWMSESPRLLSRVYERDKPSDALALKVEAQFKEYSLHPLSLKH